MNVPDSIGRTSSLALPVFAVRRPPSQGPRTTTLQTAAPASGEEMLAAGHWRRTLSHPFRRARSKQGNRDGRGRPHHEGLPAAIDVRADAARGPAGSPGPRLPGQAGAISKSSKAELVRCDAVRNWQIGSQGTRPNNSEHSASTSGAALECAARRCAESNRLVGGRKCMCQHEHNIGGRETFRPPEARQPTTIARCSRQPPSSSSFARTRHSAARPSARCPPARK